VTAIVVADAGPPIGLGRVGGLNLLRDLYEQILIPPAVQHQLCLDSKRPAAAHCAQAIAEGWLQVRAPSPPSAPSRSELMLVLDPGETEAMLLAEEAKCRFLLIDERKGRAVAKRRGIPVVGVAGVLLAAKKRGLIDAVLPILKCLEGGGYRFSFELIQEIAGLAGENHAV
jgi:predicted nucleic acid-binding protein